MAGRGHGRRGRFGVGPQAIVFDKLDELFYRCFGGHIAFHDFFAFVQGNFSRSTSHIAEIGIGHFARAVDDAAHDGDLHAFQVMCGCADAGRGFL